MDVEFKPVSRAGLPGQIADAIRDAILNGKLAIDERLPSEADLGARFGVSRPTVREALKKLAAQNLIRTTRGVTGGAFVNRLDWDTARSDVVTQATLLMSLTQTNFDTACTARFQLERACLPLSIRNRTFETVNLLRREIVRQFTKGLSDEDFCASDVAFHRALMMACGNPVLIYHSVSAVEAMQPLMNMLTYRARERRQIVDLHVALTDAIQSRKEDDARSVLDQLEAYTVSLGQQLLHKQP